MASDLRIRNLSDRHLKVVLAEYFDPHASGGFQVRNVTSVFANVTNSIGLTNTTTRRDVPQIASDTEPFDRRDVQIDVPPFSVTHTDIKPFQRDIKERLRLTFEIEGGERHRMYCPVPTAETHGLEALTDNPSIRFTGIHLPDDSYVAIYSSSDLDRWMDRIRDDVPIGALSIPGTHNAPTCHNAPPSVRCQAVSPLEQLQNGVRFFDIRVQVPEPFNGGSDRLNLVHSVFPISLTGNKLFRDLYNDCRRYLDEHPSETLVMSLKREGSGKGTDEQLSRILKDHYTNPEQWWTQPWLPTLGEARGKIVLVRRFNLDEPLKGEWDGKGWGIDGAVWADNTANAMCPSGDICVQDFYEVKEGASIDQKIVYAREHLERSGCCRYNYEDRNAKVPLFINFLSASNFWNVGTWPEKIAAKVNPAITAHLCVRHMLEDDNRVKEGEWSTGIVVCDWVGLDGDWDLVRCIVGMNSKLPRR